MSDNKKRFEKGFVPPKQPKKPAEERGFVPPPPPKQPPSKPSEGKK